MQFMCKSCMRDAVEIFPLRSRLEFPCDDINAELHCSKR